MDARLRQFDPLSGREREKKKVADGREGDRDRGRTRAHNVHDGEGGREKRDEARGAEEEQGAVVRRGSRHEGWWRERGVLEADAQIDALV